MPGPVRENVVPSRRGHFGRSRLAPGPDAAVECRLKIPPQALGLRNPPFPLRAILLRRKQDWSVLTWGGSLRAEGVREWLRPLEPHTIEFRPSGGLRIACVRLDRPPDLWDEVLASVRVHFLELAPGAAMTAVVQGSRGEVTRFVERVANGSLTPRDVQRLVRAAPEVAPMTLRQRAIVTIANVEGYYRIPRPLTELLRRAEASVVMRFVEGFVQGLLPGDDAERET
jgi:hypothetical protein